MVGMGWGKGPAALSAYKQPLLMSVSQGIWTCCVGDSSITSWAKRVPLWQPFSSVVTQKAPTLPGSTFPGTTGLGYAVAESPGKIRRLLVPETVTP